MHNKIAIPSCGGRRMKYLRSTKIMGQWLLPMIDQMDFGDEDRQGNIKSIPRNVEIERYLNRERQYLKKLTKTHLEEHLQGKGTYYYRPNRNSRLALLCIDIDPPDIDEDELRRQWGIFDRTIEVRSHSFDTEKVAEWIAWNFHEGAYWEPSTHQRGHHLYILVDRGEVGISRFNEIVLQYRNALNKLVEDEGFEAHVCSINGTHTILENDVDFTSDDLSSRKKVNRGRMAKIPRLPDGWRSLARLLSLPLTPLGSLLDLVEDPAASPEAAGTAGPAGDTSSSVITSMTTLIPDERIINESDALKRMRSAGLQAAQSFRKVPSQAELLDYYEQMGYNTGPRHRERETRARSVVRFLENTFDRTTLGTKRFNLQEYVELVEKHVTDQMKQSQAYPRLITSQDLTVAYYTVELNAFKIPNNPKDYFTCPQNAIIAMFKKLHGNEVIDRKCGRQKACAIRNILVEAGLVFIINGEWKWFGNYAGCGTAKKFGLGQNSPRHEEFMAFHKEIVDRHGEVAVDPKYKPKNRKKSPWGRIGEPSERRQCPTTKDRRSECPAKSDLLESLEF